MQPDLYTKVVLTVIALSLSWMCISGVTQPLSAQAQADRPRPTPVVLVDERGLPLMTAQGLRVNFGGQTMPVTIGNQTLSVAVSNQNVPVVINNQTLPVVLTAIERRGIWEPLQVDVVKQPPTLRPTP